MEIYIYIIDIYRYFKERYEERDNIASKYDMSSFH